MVIWLDQNGFLYNGESGRIQNECGMGRMGAGRKEKRESVRTTDPMAVALSA
jgi:hypothetical protein